MYDAIIVGGGASGFFTAINIKLQNEKAKVIIVEKTSKLLAKVKISGGGRCNVTHHIFDIPLLLKNYPRGQKELINSFSRFSTTDTINWFKNFDIKIVAEADGRMFPESNSSQTIIDCFVQLAKDFNISIHLQESVETIDPLSSNQFEVKTNRNSYQTKNVIVATGGYTKLDQFEWLENLGHTAVKPVPSLFTFNIPNATITSLMGISVKEATVTLPKFKLSYSGPLLITHWGISGPAVLKLSAFAARKLAEENYEYTVLINWSNTLSTQQCLEQLFITKREQAKKIVANYIPIDIPNRLWNYFLEKASITTDLRWADLTSIQLNQLATVLTADTYDARGKTTYKEEFVTAGGIDLKQIDTKSMQSKLHKGLYFTGETLNVDGITGGFNFQHAWTSGYIAANDITNSI